MTGRSAAREPLTHCEAPAAVVDRALARRYIPNRAVGNGIGWVSHRGRGQQPEGLTMRHGQRRILCGVVGFLGGLAWACAGAEAPQDTDADGLLNLKIETTSSPFNTP